MFTGLIKQVGVVNRQGGGRIIIDAGNLAGDCRIGDSLAVSGVCLTIVDISPPRLTMDLLEETRERTNLGTLVPGDTVNLEPALKTGEELGGHFVTGHVDGPGEVISRVRRGRDWILKISLPDGLDKYVVEKGSIALEGVSLTVAEIGEKAVSVHLIPRTFAHTNLGEKRPGARLNVETDLLGKYVVRYLEKRYIPARSIDSSFLEETGFL